MFVGYCHRCGEVATIEMDLTTIGAWSASELFMRRWQHHHLIEKHPDLLSFVPGEGYHIIDTPEVGELYAPPVFYWLN